MYARLAGEWDTLAEEMKVARRPESRSSQHRLLLRHLQTDRKTVLAQFVHGGTVREGVVIAFQQYTDPTQFREAVSG